MEENVENLMQQLLCPDHNKAYQALKELQEISMRSAVAYSYMDQFGEMLSDSNSYVRNRAIVMIACNARWDTDNKVDEIIAEYLKHIMDVKPITARQCIKMLPEIAAAKPELSEEIVTALRKANVMIYAESMQSLVYKDIYDALEKIEKIS